MRRIELLLSVILLVIVAGVEAPAQPSYRTRDVITGLDTPWEILWGPDGWLWMTERGGRISRVDPDNGEKVVLHTLTDVHEQSESGLLGMALHPQFADSPFVYIVYNYNAGGSIAEKLVRLRYDGQTLQSPQILLQNIPGQPTHNGSRLLVTPDGKLLMTTGDAQNQPGAQNHTMIVGKTLRLNLDGSVPADNPFPSAMYPANYIWTTGHRNAQGLTLGPNGRIYASEHGPNANDEVNILRARGNYGWPTVQGICDEAQETAFCNDSAVVEPIRTWTPTLAVAGIEYYGHTAISEFSGALLMTTLKESDLRVLKLSTDGSRITSETTLFNGTYGRLRDVAVAPDGRVFIATSNLDGRGTPRNGDDRIIELRATGGAGATIFAPTVTPPVLRPGAQVQVSFSATGPFTAGNVFTIELSDSSGSFDTPRVLGTLEGPNGGGITTVLPCDALPGTSYRVRVVSSDPVATSPTNGVPLVIEPSPQAVIGGVEPKGYCPGTNVQLSVSGGTRPRWSPAAGLSCTDCATPVASPTQTTTYIATVLNALGCPVSDTVTIEVLPMPTPTVAVEGRDLVAQEGFVSYLWLDAQGSTVGSGRTFRPAVNGTYVVRVIDTNGCSGVSQPIQITNLGIVDEARDRDLRVAPSPARERVSIDLALGRAATVRIELVDVRGTVVRSIERSTSGTLHETIELGRVAAGVYLLRIASGDETWVRRIVRE